ncbi:dethiobiotin synthase, partial [Hydrogenimonas sp.]
MPIEIFVTATNTDVGKTHTNLLLMEEAVRQGLRPAAFKPIETGVADTPPDG